MYVLLYCILCGNFPWMKILPSPATFILAEKEMYALIPHVTYSMKVLHLVTVHIVEVAVSFRNIIIILLCRVSSIKHT